MTRPFEMFQGNQACLVLHAERQYLNIWIPGTNVSSYFHDVEDSYLRSRNSDCNPDFSDAIVHGAIEDRAGK